MRISLKKETMKDKRMGVRLRIWGDKSDKEKKGSWVIRSLTHAQYSKEDCHIPTSHGGSAGTCLDWS